MKRRILILGKIPPPYNGPAVATQIILNSRLNEHFELCHVDTRLNDSIATMGRFGFAKPARIAVLYFKYLKSLIVNRPDLVLIPIDQQTLGFVKDSFFVFIAKMARTQVVLQLRGSNWKNWLNKASRLTQKYVRLTLSQVDGVIVLGKKLRELFVDSFESNRIFVVPNGANYVMPSRREGKGRTELLYLSNLQPSKGVRDVIDSTAILQEHDHDFHLNVVGAWWDKETRRYCIEKVNSLNLPVSFNDPAKNGQKERFYGTADAFVFTPCQPEGHPWVIVEAMAAGLPIIATDQGAITESVRDGVNGFIVAPNSPEEIADKLRILVQQPSLAKKMGQQSKKIYAEKFTEDVMVGKLVQCFNTVLNDA